jgi:hypothetical protein
MGTSKKGHKGAKSEGVNSVELRNLASKELENRQADAVRGGKGVDHSELLITKVIYKSSP